MSKYFRRVHRDGTKIRSQYVGRTADTLVSLLQRRHKLEKATQKAHRDDCEKQVDWLRKIDEAMDCYSRQLRKLLQVWLRVRRIDLRPDGSWQVKKLRRRNNETVPMKMSRDDFDELVVLAGQGNERAEESLREFMRQDRTTWRPFGDLSRLVQKQLIGSITGAASGGNQAVADASLEINLDELRDRLRRGISDPLRDLAIEQVVMAHIDTHRQALLVAEPEQSRVMVNHNDQRMKRSQKRLNEALEFLAKIDRILGLRLTVSKVPKEAQCGERDDASQLSATDGATDHDGARSPPPLHVVKTIFAHSEKDEP